MKIAINIYGEKVDRLEKGTTAAARDDVRVVTCELDNTVNILFDGAIPVCIADAVALKELITMSEYDTTDKTLKKYISVLSGYLTNSTR